MNYFVVSQQGALCQLAQTNLENILNQKCIRDYNQYISDLKSYK